MGMEITEKVKKQESNKPACKTQRDLYLDSMDIVTIIVSINQGQVSTENASV